MRFAGCTRYIEISGIRKCFEGAPPGSINLGLGQPDFDTPDHIKKRPLMPSREASPATPPTAACRSCASL